MSELLRCDTCGSWDRECASDVPVDGCGCARCLKAKVDRLTSERDDARMAIREIQETSRNCSELNASYTKELQKELEQYKLKDQIRELEYTPCTCSASYSNTETTFNQCDRCKLLISIKDKAL